MEVFGTRLISAAGHITEGSIVRVVLLLCPEYWGREGEKEKGIGEELSPSPPALPVSFIFNILMADLKSVQGV